MLGAGLGNLQTQVAGVHDILSDAGDFVSEDQGVACGGVERKVLQLQGSFCLFHTDNRVTVGFQLLHHGQGVLTIFPIHAELGAEGGFVDFRSRGHGADAAEPDLFHGEGVGAPEGGADVVLAADVVEHQHHGPFGRSLEGFDIRSVQFAVGKFAEHGGFFVKKD